MTSGTLTLWDAAGAERRAELVERSPEGNLTVQLPDDGRVIVPADAIDRHDGDDVHLTLAFADLASATGSADTETVPLVAEEAVVTKRSVPGDTVTVRTRTTEREEPIDEVLGRELAEVTRVPIDRMVDAPAPVREEGDTTIVPLHEEVLVVEKRLLLREEVHLTKRTDERRETRSVKLKREEAHVERTAPAPSDAPTDAPTDAPNDQARERASDTHETRGK